MKKSWWVGVIKVECAFDLITDDNSKHVNLLSFLDFSSWNFVAFEINAR